MEEYVFQYQYSEDDFLQLLNWQLYKKAKYRLFQIFFAILLTLALILYLISEDSSDFGFLVFIILSSFFIYLLPLYYRYLIKKQFKTNVMIHQPITFTINDEGISQTTERSNTLFKWEDFFKAAEDDNYFYLFISNIQTLILPKQELQNTEIIRQKLRQYLSEKQCKYLKK